MDASFESRLRRYAEVTVRIGVNVQAGQRLMVMAPIETAPFVRRVGEWAYRAGARLVDVLWADDALKRTRFEHAPRDSFEEYPTWRSAALDEGMRRGDAVLAVYATDPDLLAGQDPEVIAVAQRTEHRHFKPFMEGLMKGRTNWSVIAYPIPSWAAAVFPDAEPSEQVDRLWETILEVCRMNDEDPVAAWQSHVTELRRRSTWLEDHAFLELRYRAPGTDLKVGLPSGHRWRFGQEETASGIRFIANMPTEEVFTLPHRERVDGVVAASKVLSYAGTLIDGIRLTFDRGRVVEATATRGEQVLQDLIATDDGAARLGEVALVPHSSPISRADLLFSNSLYDENAACHLALGKAYRLSLAGGESMSDDELARAGGNDSLVHVDFMVGSAELDVDGVAADGAVTAVMRSGEWAF